jgi:hypothetical protein
VLALHANGPGPAAYVDLNCGWREVDRIRVVGHEAAPSPGRRRQRPASSKSRTGARCFSTRSAIRIRRAAEAVEGARRKRFRRWRRPRRTVDVRFIAANQDLAKRAEEKRSGRICCIDQHGDAERPGAASGAKTFPLAATILNRWRDMPHGKRTLTPAAVRAP